VYFRGYQSLHLTLKVIGFEGASTPMLWVALETSLYPDRDFGALGRFDSIASDGAISAVSFDRIMCYVRWNIERLDGATAVWFTIQGVAT